MHVQVDRKMVYSGCKLRLPDVNLRRELQR
jgi:hypothetical protein